MINSWTQRVRTGRTQFTTPTARGWAVGLVSIGLVAALAGCSADEPRVASVIETPGIVVEERGTSPLESDEYVEAARAAELGETLANNFGDFTIAQLTDTHDYVQIEQLWDSYKDAYVDTDADVLLYPGPPIWLPISVEQNGTGDGATIVVCDASATGWAITRESPSATYDLSVGVIRNITMETMDDSGQLRYTSSGTNTPCDATGAPVGRFKPAPVVPDEITADDVQRPLVEPTEAPNP
ncbi:MAG: hypothetical protein JWQ43_2344 [Glaciihabitans sp.]|nr:hypothetical protein [Glaciihabitans sp.]